jgi:peptidoglycan/xylan/chitin deacetylase (PgdA/CDA1 family)
MAAQNFETMMSQTIKNSIANFSNWVPLNLLMTGQDFPPFLPFYHVVSDEILDYINSYAARNTQQFEKELDYLLKIYEPVDLKTIITTQSKKQMHLTFDDGLVECSTLIAPVLKRKGIPATFFINTDFIDNKALFHRFKRSILETKGVIEKGKRKYLHHEVSELDMLAAENNIDFSTYKPYLQKYQINKLQSDGFSIGAHSLNHPEMWTLNEDDQFSQVAQSMQWVAENFQPEIKAFSFPFTDDGIKASLFEKLHYNNIVDVTFGTAGLKHDQIANHFQRIPIERTTDWSIKKTVHFEYFYYKLRHLFSANTVKR